MTNNACPGQHEDEDLVASEPSLGGLCRDCFHEVTLALIHELQQQYKRVEEFAECVNERNQALIDLQHGWTGLAPYRSGTPYPEDRLSRVIEVDESSIG